MALIEARIVKAIEDSRPGFADTLAKALVPDITAAVIMALTKEYPPEQYGDKAKGPIDWIAWRTNLLTWAAIGVIAFILTTIFFYLKAHF